MYVMMEERQLRRYPFFRLLGAFSVVREDPRDAARALLYARSLLKTPGTVVWIFPQGVMHPSDHRPLAFFGGAAQLARAVPGVRIMPAAVRCDFLGEQRPECFIELGAPEAVPDNTSVEAMTAAMEERVTGILDRLRDDILASRLGEFRILLTGGASTNVRLDRMMGRS
jgi:1-acyl-sn-glycerol-3-phosphate acyltransferase